MEGAKSVEYFFECVDSKGYLYPFLGVHYCKGNLLKMQIPACSSVYTLYMRLVWRLSEFAFLGRWLRPAPFLFCGGGMEILNACCFFGHRRIEESPQLIVRLKNAIELLILEQGVDTFYFGSKSAFDRLCLETVTELKKGHPHIKRIYVRAEFPYIDDGYKKYLLQSYEDTYYPEKLLRAGSASYVERNFEMIDRSKYCICYYDEHYTPPKRKNGKGDFFEALPKSGTKIAYEYAEKRKRVINNVAIGLD